MDEQEKIIIQAKPSKQLEKKSSKNAQTTEPFFQSEPTAALNENGCNTNIPIIDASSFDINIDYLAESSNTSNNLNQNEVSNTNEILINEPNVVVYHETSSNSSPPSSVYSDNNANLITFDTSQGFISFNPVDSNNPNEIPTNNLNTQNLYNLLIRLQQNNQLELNRNDSSLTCQFYMSSEELNSLLGPNQIINQIEVDTNSYLGFNNANSNQQTIVVEPSQQHQQPQVQDILHDTFYVASNSQNMENGSAVTNFQTQTYPQNTVNSFELTNNPQVLVVEQPILINQTNQENAQKEDQVIKNQPRCQELCCLLKFNALIDYDANLI
jgi:hypothetical protein